MGNLKQKVTGVRVLDIAEEGTKAIEAMFNNLVEEINQQGIPIVDIKMTESHCFILLGEKKPTSMRE